MPGTGLTSIYTIYCRICLSNYFNSCLSSFSKADSSVIINNETEYTEADLDLIAGVEITGKLPDNYPYESISLKEHCYASLICKKEAIEEAYRSMLIQLNTLNCQIIGAFIEIYYEDDTVELKVPVCKLSRTEVNIEADNKEIPFVNDPDVIGKWTLLDMVPSREQFLYGKPKCKDQDNLPLKDLYFLPEGTGYWVIHSWTKGSIATISGDYPNQILRNNYSVVKENGKILLFIEMKSYWFRRGGQPIIYVYEKISDKKYSRDDLQIKDNTDLPFLNDESVIGKWIVRDFVREQKMFDATKQNWQTERLFFKKVTFNPNGTAGIVYSQNTPYNKTWTKGYLLDARKSTAEAYHIEKIDGKDYLFIEWKSGDYTYGGKKPCWYVFIRE